MNFENPASGYLTVNKIVNTWNSQKVKVAQDSPKINMWAGMLKTQLIGPFFFEEDTIRNVNFLNMLTILFIPS